MGRGAPHTEWGAKQAVMDFRALHDIVDPMRDIDGWGAYWQKSRNVVMRRKLYTNAVTNSAMQTLRPNPPLTAHDYMSATRAWNANLTADEHKHLQELYRGPSCSRDFCSAVKK